MNLNTIKEKLAKLQGQQKNNSSDKIWKPKAGKTVIRILPYKFQEDNPFVELLFHYEVTKRTMVSPASFGDPDPIVEFAEQIRRQGDKESYRLSRKIEPKMRTYVPILIRGEENEGVKFWGFGKQVYEELLKTIDDPDYGDIADVKTGRDITIEFEPAKSAEDFPSTTVRAKPSPTPVTTDRAVLDLIKAMPNLTDIFQVPSYDELKALLEKFINNTAAEDTSTSVSNDEEVDEIPDIPTSPAKSNENKPTPTALTDIDQAFDDIFN